MVNIKIESGGRVLEINDDTITLFNKTDSELEQVKHFKLTAKQTEDLRTIVTDEFVDTVYIAVNQNSLQNKSKIFKIVGVPFMKKWFNMHK